MDQDNHCSESEPLSLDACLEVLANHQRRVIIGHFLEGDTDHTSIETLVTAITDEIARRTGERPGHDSVEFMLYHVHLPKLAEVKLIEYDTRHLDVRYQGDSRMEELYAKIQDFE